MASIRHSDFFANLPPPAECLAILVGCAETFAFGLAGLANPLDFSKGYGLPIETTPDQDQEPTENQKIQSALVQAIAARNLQMGALVLTFACYVRDRRALGFAVGSCFVTTLADTLIVRKYGVPNAVAGHAFGMFNTLAISASLLLWKRTDRFW